MAFLHYLARLTEYGLLVNPALDSEARYDSAVARRLESGFLQVLPFGFQGRWWTLRPIRSPAETYDYDSAFRLPGVALSGVGKELLPVVDCEPMDAFLSDFATFLESKGMTLVESDQPRLYERT